MTKQRTSAKIVATSSTKYIVGAIRRKATGYERDALKRKGRAGLALSGDASDLRYVARLVEQGEIVAALRVARNLDTAIREDLPASFWRLWKPGMPAGLKVTVLRRRQ